MSTEWVYGSANVTGSGHKKAVRACEDYCLVEILNPQDQEILLIAVSDGAGSAAKAAEGAKITCESFISNFRRLLLSNYGEESIAPNHIEDWLMLARGELESLACVGGLAISDFACTFLGAIVSENRSTFVQIGDGAIVVKHADSDSIYETVFWPTASEYANSTFFVTGSRPLDHLLIDIKTRSILEIAIFTDGLQRLALNISDKKPHFPFFQAILSPLKSLERGHSEVVNKALDQLLNSQQVLERTDDDKALVLASRSPQIQ